MAVGEERRKNRCIVNGIREKKKSADVFCTGGAEEDKIDCRYREGEVWVGEGQR